MKKIIFGIAFVLIAINSFAFAQAEEPFFSVPQRIEVEGNGLNSISFAVKMQGVSEEVERIINYFIGDVPKENPPIFNKKDRLFYWRPNSSQVGLHTFKFTALDIFNNRYVRFNARGIPSESGQLHLKNDKGRYRGINIGLTGNLKMIASDDGVVWF